MPKYNDFELDIQNNKIDSNPSVLIIDTKYCHSMWCTEMGCSTEPTTSIVAEI